MRATLIMLDYFDIEDANGTGIIAGVFSGQRDTKSSGKFAQIMTNLNQRLLASLSVQLQLKLPHSIFALPQLLSSPPLALLALPLQVGELLCPLLQAGLQLLDAAAQALVLLRADKHLF